MIVKTGIAETLLLRALTVLLAFATLVPLCVPATAYGADATFTFNGGGWGHGIGLSQYGAKGYAERGWDYQRILTHYYQGTRLETKPNLTVRVNLDRGKDARSQWQVQASTDTSLTFVQASDTAVRVTVRKLVGGSPAKYWVTTIGGNTRVHEDEHGAPGAVLKAFSGRCYVGSASPIRIVGSSGPFGHAGVAWHGRLHFIPETTTRSLCVNYVELEDYLKGVVPRESPSSWPVEALKAQAVAARSYAYDDAANKRVLWCTTMSQVYNGHSRTGYLHEAASTNSAVAATKGKVVWYGSETKPVKTYFSSSSGGHTANIEDVWFSTPRPYYRGVVDADDSGNPYYTWSSGPLAASTLSDKIRAKVGSSYSAPSPHVITGVNIERASTGHARYVTLTWSNGSRYKIKGDTVRSALGLKSTKFTVVTTSSTNVYSERNSRLAWSGVWKTVRNYSAYGDTYKRTSLPRSQVVARFKGTGVVWIGTKARTYGRASIAIDGVKVATVDLYSYRTLTRQKLFSKTGLADGEHTITITALRSRNSRSSSYGVSVDRINVVGGELLAADTPVQRYQDAWSRVAALGGWSTEVTSAASGGSHIVNSRTGSKVVVDFYGTGIDWIGAKAPAAGSAKVSVDGGPSTTVSLAAPATAHQQTLFSSGPLSPTTLHRITIETVGPQGSSNGTVSVDRFDVTGGWVQIPKLPLTIVQESGVNKTGRWTVYRNSLASGGSHIVNGTAGASVTLPFEGNAVAWYGARTRWYGKAEVLLDGKRVAIVDLYSPTTKLNQRIWSASRLSAKGHTLTIRVLGRKRSTALGTLVSVDRINVRGQVAPD